jgi:P-type Mg2+ transporter
MNFLTSIFKNSWGVFKYNRDMANFNAQKLISSANLPLPELYQQLNTTEQGLNDIEVEARLAKFGKNEVAREERLTWWRRLFNNIKDPLVILLTFLALISFLTGDLRATTVIGIMIVLGVILRYFQESRADNAAAKLKAMVSTSCTVFRDGKQSEIPLEQLVPGDIVILSAGDMVPGDVRILTAKDLFINQSSLTGESIPVEKVSTNNQPDAKDPLGMDNLCFLGSNVDSGTGSGVVVQTGKDTYFGSLAHSIIGQRVLTSFDKGITQFTWLMIGFMAVMVPLVFLINGISKHNWLDAFLFAMAVAVGLTPEMLPMIVTVNLSNGALAMSKKKVIVKRLNSIQNFGAMDMLCTDKTGTLTEGRIVLVRHIDVRGNESDRVLEIAYLNSYFQTGLKNLMDVAILNFRNLETDLKVGDQYRKIDEIPFDFTRKRMSVILEDKANNHDLICKGAVEAVMPCCTKVEINGELLDRLPEHDEHRAKRIEELNALGFRVVALAHKVIPNAPDIPTYSVKDESDLILLGFLAFLDPPKDSASEAISKLDELHVSTKILTGDNEIVSRYICSHVGLPVDKILLGPEIESMDDQELADCAEQITVFARLSPAHKERIIHALQGKGHVVGFMGDGINDAPALRAADVGISVNTAVDIAKESSDIILLETSLLVLRDGVMEGRRVFGNITKYIKMAASSNFGNMFSVIGASAFLPFVPMLPIQVLTNNLMYDFSQVPIPTDNVDQEWLVKPRKWAIGEIRRFIIFIGPISSIFDYATYFLMLFVFKAWADPAMFHTGWFVESLFTQTLIIHVIRTNRIPFLQSRASLPLLLTSLAIVGVGIYLPYSPIAGALGFVPLPPIYWLYLVGMMITYMLITQGIKTWFYKKYGD